MSNGNRKSNPNIPNIALTFYDVLGRVTPYILMYFESMELKPRFLPWLLYWQKYYCSGLYGQIHNMQRNYQIWKCWGPSNSSNSYSFLDHLDLLGLTDEEVLNNELSRTKSTIVNLVGKNPVYFLPLHASINDK